jgi:hypothetical protein
MPTPTYFFQECPTCGRSLQVLVEYLGHRVACRHCRAGFMACDPESGIDPPDDSGLGLLRRANALLAEARSKKLQRQQTMAD